MKQKQLHTLTVGSTLFLRPHTHLNENDTGGDEVSSGAFATWRGERTPIAGTWNDNSAAVQVAQWSLDNTYRTWTGDIDVAGKWSAKVYMMSAKVNMVCVYIYIYISAVT